MQRRFNAIADKEDRVIRMNTNKSSIKLGILGINVRLEAVSPKTHNTLSRYYRAYIALCNLISEAAYTYNTVDLNQILPRIRNDAELYAKKYPGLLFRAFNTVTREYANHVTGTDRFPAPRKYTLNNIPVTLGEDYTVTLYGDNQYGLEFRLAHRTNAFSKAEQFYAEWLNLPAGYSCTDIAPTGTLSYDAEQGWVFKYDLPVIQNKVVGIDMGTRFFAVTYDGERTNFLHGAKTPLQHEMTTYSNLHQKLKKKGTRSARKRLKAISDSWREQLNVRIKKTVKDILNDAEPDTVFILERLTVPHNLDERLVTADIGNMSAAIFALFNQELREEAKKRGHMVLYTSASGTSARCPSCGIFKKRNRKHDTHSYQCPCGFWSNDDRVAAMNIRERGITYLVERFV
jgi:predicted RNA-binding Zn-ribbon protein involved in translation (DUF1610 family)